MKLDELISLVAQGESERLEMKRSTGELTTGMRTVCAMLNGLGGFMLFGVGNRGELVGQQVSADTLADVANALRRIESPAFPDVETVALENGKAVVAPRVSGGGGPYTCDGRPYHRLGPTTSVMPRRRYEHVLLERMHASDRWENQPAHGLHVHDLDGAEIIRTIEEAIRRQRMDDPGTRDSRELPSG